MKKTIIVAALLALSILTLTGMGGNKQEPAKPQFGVVESTKLYQESKVGKAGVARLEQLQKDALAKLDVMQADLKKAQDDKDDAAAQRLQMEMQNSLYNLQAVMTSEQDKVVAVIRTAMEKCMEKYRADHALFGLFGNETLLSYGKEMDVTVGVMELLDKETVDFGPMPSLETPVAPEPQAIPGTPAAPEKSDITPAAPEKK